MLPELSLGPGISKKLDDFLVASLGRRHPGGGLGELLPARPFGPGTDVAVAVDGDVDDPGPQSG